MAYGKGSFTAQDKILPGMYVNIKGEADLGSELGARGKVAVALELDWGDEGKIFKVTQKEFYADSKKIFGYDYRDEKMKTLREIFKGATEVYVYRLKGEGSGAAKVSSVDGVATAKYPGARGNDIKIEISQTVGDDTSLFDVVTMLDNVVVDRQLGVTASTIKANDYVEFLGISKTGTNQLGGGANATIDKTAHTPFLNELESYQVNVVGYVGEDADIKNLYSEWVMLQRDAYGNTIQAVLCDQASNHEGVINVDDIKMVPWVMGKSAGCPLNASLQNVIYDGEEVPDVKYTQAELEDALLDGKFVLHRVGETYRVLADINSLVTVVGEKTEDFKYNQTIRVIDQITVDVTNVWNDHFLGKVPSNETGRIAFWNRAVSVLNEYLDMGAIEKYDKSLVTVAEGIQRGSVVMTIPVQVATMLEKAYVTIMVQ